jgi:hypothetical protein
LKFPDKADFTAVLVLHSKSRLVHACKQKHLNHQNIEGSNFKSNSTTITTAKLTPEPLASEPS